MVAVGAVALMGAFLTACLGNPNFPTVVEPVVFTITDLRVGTGAGADNGDLLTLEFTLWLYDETQPDFKGQQVSTTVGNPLKFLVGSGSAIAAINRGVVGMQVGGQRRLLVPPNLAFGSTGSAGIQPNSSLVIDIEVLRLDPVPSFTITDLVVGTGAVATDGDILNVEYVLWLYDPTLPDAKGLELETSGGTPISVRLGDGVVIEGWERGLLGMRVGGERRLVIPHDLAYGASGRGQIPPYASLVFDIRLVSIG